MANDKNPSNPSPQTDDEKLKRELRRDPEFEMPDPEQVERDIEQAQKTYRPDDKKRGAA